MDGAVRHLQPRRDQLLGLLGRPGWGRQQSVEQTGTSSDCDAGTPSYSAWYEFFPENSVSLPNTVKAGDKIKASVVAVAGSDQYKLVLTDTTQNWTKTQTGASPSGSGASAEIIAEAPSGSTNGNSVLPLANFKTVTFADVQVDGKKISDFASARKIAMVASDGSPMASVSALTNGDSFSVKWLGSGADSTGQDVSGQGSSGWPQIGDGSGSTGSGSTGSGSTGSGGQGDTTTADGWGDTGLGDTGWGDTGLGDTGWGDTGLGDSGWSDSGWGNTGLGDSGWGDSGYGYTGGSDTGGYGYGDSYGSSDLHRQYSLGLWLRRRPEQSLAVLNLPTALGPMLCSTFCPRSTHLAEPGAVRVSVGRPDQVAGHPHIRGPCDVRCE